MAKKQAELQKQIEILENVAKQYMTKEAIERYGNLKSAHPEKAIQAITLIVQLIQSNQLTQKLSDEDFKNILLQLEQKKDFKLRL